MYGDGTHITISVFFILVTPEAISENNFSASFKERGFIFQLPIIIFLLFILSRVYHNYLISFQDEISHEPDGPLEKLLFDNPDS